jgi:hypothetical protein
LGAAEAEGPTSVWPARLIEWALAAGFFLLALTAVWAVFEDEIGQLVSSTPVVQGPAAPHNLTRTPISP